MSPFIKTNGRQASGIPRPRRRSGQAGNTNAARPVNTLSRRLKDLKRRIRAALKAAA